MAVLPVRIISGELRRLTITIPRGEEVRPTSDRVRESLFSVVGGDVVDSCVLDLFAGAGTLGIEAISRGASHVTFVEKSSRVAEVLTKNLSRLGVLDRATVMKDDALSAIQSLTSRGARFGLVFMDPPYSKSLAQKGMVALASGCIVAEHGTVVVEHNRKESLANQYGLLNAVRMLEFGGTSISIYRRHECQNSYTRARSTP